MRRKRRGAVVVGREKGGCALARSWFYFGGILEGVGGVPWVPQWWTRQISSGMLSVTRSVMPQRARITARKARAGDRASKVRSYGCVCQDQGSLVSCLACLRARALSLSPFFFLPFSYPRSAGQRTMPIASPSMNTSAWSATVPGLVRKKKPRVMWKSDREVRIVFAEMSAMAGRRAALLGVAEEAWSACGSAGDQRGFEGISWRGMPAGES